MTVAYKHVCFRIFFNTLSLTLIFLSTILHLCRIYSSSFRSMGYRVVPSLDMVQICHLVPIGNPFALSTNGDTVICYCVEGNVMTTKRAYHFLGAISFSGSWSLPGWNTYSSKTSALPNTLIGLAPALPQMDNYVYRGSLSGSKELIQAALMDPQNWEGSNSKRLHWD